MRMLSCGYQQVVTVQITYCSTEDRYQMCISTLNELIQQHTVAIFYVFKARYGLFVASAN